MIKNTRNDKVTNNIVEYIKTQFIDGKLPAGSRLPPERKLALDFGISRASVREAISILKTMGILEVRHRAGIFVSGVKTFPDVAHNSNIEFNTINYTHHAIQLIEFLSIMISAAVPLIISRSKDDDLKTLKITIERINSCIGSGMKSAWFELEFLMLLTKLSGNTFFYQVVSSMKNTLVKVLRTGESEIILDNLAKLQYMTILKDLSRAIMNKDIDGIKFMLDSYFNLIKQFLMKNT